MGMELGYVWIWKGRGLLRFWRVVLSIWGGVCARGVWGRKGRREDEGGKPSGMYTIADRILWYNLDESQTTSPKEIVSNVFS